MLGESRVCVRYSRSYKRFCANVTGARLYRVGHSPGYSIQIHTEARCCSQAEEADDTTQTGTITPL